MTTTTNTPAPLTVDFDFEIVRESDPDYPADAAIHGPDAIFVRYENGLVVAI